MMYYISILQDAAQKITPGTSKEPKNARCHYILFSVYHFISSMLLLGIYEIHFS